MKTAKRLSRKVAKRRLTKKIRHKGGEGPIDDGEYTIVKSENDKTVSHAKIKIYDNIITKVSGPDIILHGYNNVISENLDTYLNKLVNAIVPAENSKGLFIGRGSDGKLEFRVYRQPSDKSPLKIARVSEKQVGTKNRLERVINVGSIPDNFFINYIMSETEMVDNSDYPKPEFCQPIYADIGKPSALSEKRANINFVTNPYNAPKAPDITRQGGKNLFKTKSVKSSVIKSVFRVPMESNRNQATKNSEVSTIVEFSRLYAKPLPKDKLPPASSSTGVNFNTHLYKMPKGTTVNTPPRPTAPKPTQ